ncbi:UDP-N-acetylmuramoyl-tripeptide--D-alanyl-D-alanine ligase [Arachidicoccus rhizosphaerae]|uniref:Alanine racemase n=1 Tax=Arachidicoccus rhizosphaerae TaxID=551991 RepID=A0A1H4C9I7_9BACT|nr:bifunctional UDP-N-acetylmuramoyl-tripeptide:D-alanyl-D-alanine ligase/alanine racemase [Arachidicoccus rhizosphaerae]SEA57018.1 UDP-N-acetylmuramoyl-tripeptide--D-alanyl-D-alanine ligase [Arachidicoccus rhizosphaerae]
MGYSIKDIAAVLDFSDKADVARLQALSPEVTLKGHSRILRENDMIEHLTVDSRKISFAGSSLFFALKTSNRDGLDYALQAYEAGIRNFVLNIAALSLVEGESASVSAFDWEALQQANLIFVPDTLEALQYLVSWHRQQFRYPVIGITGSNGKTIVKEWLNYLLESNYKVVRSPRSFNSQIGVPLSVWEMTDADNLGIFEAGISTVGEMDKLQSIILPEIGILTGIGDAHDSGFDSKLQKLREKLLLFKQSKILFYHAEDNWIEKEVRLTFSKTANQPQVRLVRIGADENADIRLTQIKVDEKRHTTIISAVYQAEATWSDASGQGQQADIRQMQFEIPFTDAAALQNAGTCLAVCLYLGLSTAGFISKVQGLPAIDMRLQVLPAINRCSVINDSYSLDQRSLQVALDLLNQQLPSKTLILSDIPGLNQTDAPTAYRQMADLILNKKVNRVITVGAQWKRYAALLKVPVLEQYDSTEALTRTFQPGQFKDEAILLKGARSFQFEEIFYLLQEKVHQTRLEINLTAIVHNQKMYRSLLQPGVKMMAMVKAFAYGSGLLEMASVLQYHHIDYLTVAYADEGVVLRNGGITTPVMVMNVDQYAFETLVAHQLEPEIYSFRILKEFMAFLSAQGLSQYPVHIKLDTGMHRLGFDPDEVDALGDLLSRQKTVYVKSAFSHFTSSEDDGDDQFTHQQAKLLLQGCAILENKLGYGFIRHIANTAAIARFPEYQLDMVRLGIGLYGINTTSESLPIRTVATLKATIAQIKEIAPGQTVGYNRMGKVAVPTRTATIRIGYADGFSRMLSNGRGKVLLHGKICPVIGNVCMDMTMININAVPTAMEGDEVEIFGPELPVQQMAAASGTSSYEIFTSIGQRINRIYVED